MQSSLLKIALIFLPLLSLSCHQAPPEAPPKPLETIPQVRLQKLPDRVNYSWLSDFEEANCLVNRIPLPPGFERVPVSRGSFGEWLRYFPLKPGQPEVMLFDGQKKQNQSAQAAVLDIDVGSKDLQQCADAAMRLRGEYLFAADQKTRICFDFTSGDAIPYTRWADGEKPKVSGNRIQWVAATANDDSYSSFRRYMELIFMYAGTASLEKEMQPLSPPAEIQAGDLFIQGGFPGHAVTIMDVAKNQETGKTIFLISQSYMPAQDVHLLKNPSNPSLSPWYEFHAGTSLETPEWEFDWSDLRRYRSSD